jgi:hypothetical protein
MRSSMVAELRRLHFGLLSSAEQARLIDCDRAKMQSISNSSALRFILVNEPNLMRRACDPYTLKRRHS